MGDQSRASEKYKAALEALSKFRPLYGYDEEVSDATRAKILRAMGDNQGALDGVAKHVGSRNPYTNYEQAKGLLWRASCSDACSDYGHALTLVREAFQLLKNFSTHHRLPPELSILLAEAMEREERLKVIVNGSA